MPKVCKVKNDLIDVFMDYSTSPTGFEENCWLRLHKNKQGQWKQIAGVKLPSYRYQAVVKNLSTTQKG